MGHMGSLGHVLRTPSSEFFTALGICGAPIGESPAYRGASSSRELTLDAGVNAGVNRLFGILGLHRPEPPTGRR
jgi:hypothetical protein